MYGLKQAPRAWYEKIHANLIAHGFENSPNEQFMVWFQVLVSGLVSVLNWV